MKTPVIRISGALLAAGLSYLALTTFPAPGAGSGDSKRSSETRKMVEAARGDITKGEFELALHPSLELHKQFPQNHVYMEQLATVYGHLRKYADEAAMWEEYLVYSPVPIEGCPQVGVAWRNLGQTAKAMDAFRRCLGFEANNPDVFYQLAYTSERSDPKTAEATYRKGLQYAPTDSDLILGLGRVQLRQGNTAMAEKAAQAVLARLPDNADALLLAGLALSRLDKTEDARRLLEHGAAVSPGYTDIHLALAALAERRRDIPGAIAKYERVLQLDPENGEASIRLAALRSAKGPKR
jgi:tetratricopeptide (TPR) repeat protein